MKLKKVAPEWYNLGLQLRLTESVLDIIDKDDGRDSSTCMRKMFSKWLSSSMDASYTGLVDALISIDMKDVAEDVSQEFCEFQFRYTYYMAMHVFYIHMCCNYFSYSVYVCTYIRTYVYTYV